MRSYRASALGSCARAQIALQLGHAALGLPEKVQGYMDRGVTHEVDCLLAMETEGWDVTQYLDGFPSEDKYGTMQVLVELEVAGAIVRGRMDGVVVGHLVDGHASAILEIKAPQTWAKLERACRTGDFSDPMMHRAAYQISVYMVATGLEAVVACVEDGQVRTFGIEVPPFNLEQITGRVNWMEAWVIKGLIPDECSQADYPCPVAYLHDRPEITDDPVLRGLIEDYELHKATKDEADAAMKVLRLAMDTHLGIEDTVTTDFGTVTRVPPSTPMSWKDTVEAAEAAGIDLKPYYKRGKRAGYINVTPRESSD